MSIVEKIYAGVSLTERERRQVSYCDVEGIDEEVAVNEFDSGRWTQAVQTVFRIGNDLWAIDWDRGLTEYQENEYYEDPYRVERVERQVTVVDYVSI